LLKNLVVAVSMMALALSGAASASIIGNGPPNQTGGSDLNAFLEADNFSLGNQAHIVTVQYWTLQVDSTDYAGTTQWGFYKDASGMPGSTAVVSGNTVAAGSATGNTTLGLNEFSYIFSVNVTLAPGNYWLVLHNGPSSTIPSTNYYWAWSSDSGDSQSADLSLAPPIQWAGNASELAFQLTGTIAPEPSASGLVAGGLLAA
jgi:hypothetical protein